MIFNYNGDKNQLFDLDQKIEEDVEATKNVQMSQLELTGISALIDDLAAEYLKGDDKVKPSIKAALYELGLGALKNKNYRDGLNKAADKWIAISMIVYKDNSKQFERFNNLLKELNFPQDIVSVNDVVKQQAFYYNVRDKELYAKADMLKGLMKGAHE